MLELGNKTAKTNPDTDTDDDSDLVADVDPGTLTLFV